MRRLFKAFIFCRYVLIVDVWGEGCMSRSEFEYLLSIEDQLSEYVGKWIAVVGEEIVAVGSTAIEVFKKAKEKYPDKEPMILNLPAERVMLL
mgnify:CR=1 FL=1